MNPSAIFPPAMVEKGKNARTALKLLEQSLSEGAQICIAIYNPCPSALELAAINEHLSRL